MMPTLCDFPGAEYLFIGPNVAPLVYYSHLPVAIVTFLTGAYLLYRNWRALPNQILFIITTTFAAWVFLDSIFWATNRSDVVMATWATIVLIEPLVHVAGLYLLYVLVDNRDPSFIWKLIFFVFYLPLILSAPTTLNLSGFDLASCLANEGPIAHYYSYGLEILIMAVTLLFAVVRIGQAATWKRRGEILALSAGTFLLMFAFSWGNIIGSFTDEWEIAQYGLFGMPLFIAFFVYSIVRYRTFSMKIVGAAALVFALCALNFALLFIQEAHIFRTIAGITFGISVIFGFMLIRSVNREVAQREHIEKLAQELEQTNERQEGLLHFIGHEVKGSLTKDEGAFAALMDGDFGALPESAKSFVANALAQARDGVRSVTDILTASNQKKGTVSYAKEPFDLRALIVGSIEKAQTMAQAKGLVLSLSVDEAGAPYSFTGDKEKIAESVLRNIIENSINYTPTGSVTASLKKEGGKFIFAIRDTGVGISDEDKKNLFTAGGHGKESQRVNVHSTGYGLFIAKNIVEAHGGTIRAESEGVGKGSTFIVEFPA